METKIKSIILLILMLTICFVSPAPSKDSNYEHLEDSIQTNNATNVETRSVTLNGYTSLDNATVWFEFTNETAIKTINISQTTGNFSTDLNPVHNWYYFNNYSYAIGYHDTEWVYAVDSNENTWMQADGIDGRMLMNSTNFTELTYDYFKPDVTLKLKHSGGSPTGNNILLTPLYRLGYGNGHLAYQNVSLPNIIWSEFNITHDTNTSNTWSNTDFNDIEMWVNTSSQPSQSQVYIVELLVNYSLSPGTLYQYRAVANGTYEDYSQFLTKPEPLTNFTATNNVTAITLSWINYEGGKGAYIEYTISPAPSPWNVGNGTPINITGYISGTTYSQALPYGYHYKAWAYANDSGVISDGSNTRPFNDGGTATLFPPWDINQDGAVNYLDVSLLVSHYSETGIPGWIPEDINDDGDVNYLDVSLLVTHYGEEY